MKTKYLMLAAAFAVSPVFAAGSNSNASGQSSSDSGAMAATGPITFQGANVPDHTTIYTTPPIYTAPSAFGFNGNCGGSNTKTLGTPWFGFGSSDTHGMFDCNVRADATMAWKMGLQAVAVLRMFCFGSDLNRKAYEASGHQCPASGTAKGIADAPQLPKILAVAPQVKRGHINADGTITWEK